MIYSVIIIIISSSSSNSNSNNSNYDCTGVNICSAVIVALAVTKVYVVHLMNANITNFCCLWTTQPAWVKSATKCEWIFQSHL